MGNRTDTRFSLSVTVAALIASIMTATSIVMAGESARGKSYQVFGGAPASVAAVAISPAHQVLVTGGSGAAIGIAVSQNTSIVGGNDTSGTPTERIFRGTFDE